MGYSIKCMSCHKKTPWNPQEGYPKECASCGYDFGPERDDDDIVLPFIRSSGRTQATDDVYNQMAAASEQRVHQASEASGIPASELSDLKITDLRPTTIPGSVAAPPLPAHLSNVGGYQAQGNEWAGLVRSGPEPNAGARTLLRMQRLTGRG